MFKRYIEYIKDNPEGYWFKRKLFGWGWTPARWQGWLVILAFVGFIVWSGVSLASVKDPTDAMIKWFFVKIALSIILLILICIKKGEKPRWQWGFPKE